MKIKNYIAGSILFFAIMACVNQPGISPTLDPSTLPTIIVLTANAAMTQTATAAPPKPAETAPSVPETDKTSIEQLSDTGTKYTDGNAGFEVIYPKGWLTLRPNSDEFNSALKKEAGKNEMLRSQMELDLNDNEPGVDRLFSYPVRPDLEKNFVFGYSNLEWDTEDSALIDENGMGKLVRGLESSGAIPGFRADTAQVYENTNHVKMVEVGGQFPLGNGQGEVTPFYLTAIFFKPNDSSTVRISFTYLKEYKLSLSLDVTSVINSIKLLE
jgi:hypothetical protein